MELGVAVGTYNRLVLLRKCLFALKNGVHIPCEITVIDGGSTDGTVEYLENLPGIHLVQDGGLVGQAKSLNRVFKSLETEYVCWLSDDNIVVDGALDQAVGILKNNPAIGMVGLKIKDITGPYINQPYLGGIWESGVLNCNQGMLPTSLLRQLGGFDEGFRDYGIDIDLTTRVLLAGYKVVYTKQMAIHHYRDHETDNWITKSNREHRIQSARELYRSRYAMLIGKDRLPSKPALSKSDSLPSSSDSQASPVLLVYLHQKLVKHLRIVYYKLVKHLRIIYYKLVKYSRMTMHAINIILSERVVGHRISAFFRDLYNIRKGRFVSKWDLLKNHGNTYYLVQQIPNTIREQVKERSNHHE